MTGKTTLLEELGKKLQDTLRIGVIEGDIQSSLDAASGGCRGPLFFGVTLAMHKDILHVLDHSIPRTDGYAIRSKSIVEIQRRLGMRPVVVTSALHSAASKNAHETIGGVTYYRTALPRGWINERQLNRPFLRKRLLMKRPLCRRLLSSMRASRSWHPHRKRRCGT